MGNVGGVNASMNSSAVVVDPHDPSKLVAVWQDNDPTMAAVTLNGGQWSPWRRRIRSNGGQTWLPLFAEPTNAGGMPIAAVAAQPGDERPDGPLCLRDQSRAWGSTTATTSTS